MNRSSCDTERWCRKRLRTETVATGVAATPKPATASTASILPGSVKMPTSRDATQRVPAPETDSAAAHAFVAAATVATGVVRGAHRWVPSSTVLSHAAHGAGDRSQSFRFPARCAELARHFTKRNRAVRPSTLPPHSPHYMSRFKSLSFWLVVK